jgi:glycogen synthase kinase 3 beta
MDYLPMTLAQFVTCHRQQRMYPPILFVKLFLFQVFSGLHYLHSIGITHRDIKPTNIIVDSDTGELKICDFGSAKMLKPGEKSVAYIASRYYRAPELVMGCTEYTTKIDIWATGCVFAECIMGGVPIFPGTSSESQLTEIFKVIGPPTESDLSSFIHTYRLENPQRATTSLERTLPTYTPFDIVDLLKKIFVYDPRKRPSALDCMKHRCFDDLFGHGILLPSKRPIPMLERSPPASSLVANVPDD